VHDRRDYDYRNGVERAVCVRGRHEGGVGLRARGSGGERPGIETDDHSARCNAGSEKANLRNVDRGL
jgi:hypothetical protein